MIYASGYPPVAFEGWLLVLVSLALAVAFSPLAVLFAYVVRISAILKRTSAPGAFTPSGAYHRTAASDAANDTDGDTGGDTDIGTDGGPDTVGTATVRDPVERSAALETPEAPAASSEERSDEPDESDTTRESTAGEARSDGETER